MKLPGMFYHLTLRAISFLLLILSFISIALASEAEWKHGDTLFGELRYPKEFSHYEHVNPDAQKGGTFNASAYGGYDSFNPFVVRGRAAAGLNYSGGILFDTLFEQALDQPSASYGLIADKFHFADDYSFATYHLNPKAKWHDGKQITPEDVIWSLKVLREHQPLYSNYYKNVAKAEKTGDQEVTFSFDTEGNRELPHIMGDLPVLPKHWWEGIGADGNKRDFSQPTEEPPLGSGPYKIKSFKLGNSITWERVQDYWAKDINVRKGRYNFDTIKYTYFGDFSAIWEAFKKGGIEDLHLENRSQRWAEEYIFPAFEREDVIRNVFSKVGSQQYQAFFYNTRKSKFSNRELREALSLLFDFETMNKNMFHDLYTRTDSYFEGGELQSHGLPEGRELEILEAYRGKIPDELFNQAFKLPVINSASDTRKLQRRALGLLKEAGYTFEGGKMLDQDGQQFSIEFLGNNPTAERISGPFIENLKKLGIDASLRIVDNAQYKNRLDNFDFEIITGNSIQSLSPGNEQREYWSSASADQAGARNFAGIKNPVIDELVERIIKADTREELIALTKALDRVLLWNYYSIPQWHKPALWVAWWRKLKFPNDQPSYTGFDQWSGWIDTEVEEELAQ